MLLYSKHRRGLGSLSQWHMALSGWTPGKGALPCSVAGHYFHQGPQYSRLFQTRLACCSFRPAGTWLAQFVGSYAVAGHKAWSIARCLNFGHLGLFAPFSACSAIDFTFPSRLVRASFAAPWPQLWPLERLLSEIVSDHWNPYSTWSSRTWASRAPRQALHSPQLTFAFDHHSLYAYASAPHRTSLDFGFWPWACFSHQLPSVAVMPSISMRPVNFEHQSLAASEWWA